MAQVAAFDRPESDLFENGVEEGRLDPLHDLAGHEPDVRLPGRDDVDPALAGQARLDGDLDVLLEFGDEVDGDGDRHACLERAVDLGEDHVGHASGVDPGDSHGAARADALAVAEVDLDLAPGGQESWSVACHDEQNDQAGECHHRHQADADLMARSSRTHRPTPRGERPR